MVMPVSAVFPAALFGDGLEDLGGSPPAFLGCLREIAGGQFLLGLGQELLAGLLLRLGGHGQSPGVLSGYQVRRAGGKENSLAEKIAKLVTRRCGDCERPIH